VRSAWAIYLATAVFAELAMPYAPVATALLDAALLVAVLTHIGLAERSPIAFGDPGVRVLAGIALIPLLRILSLTLPLPTVESIFWLAFAAPPALLAVLASARLAALDVQEMALTRFGIDPLSAIIVVAGVPLGIVLGLLVPSPFEWDVRSPAATGLMVLVLVGGAAIPEELVYRGVLQPLLSELTGRLSPFLTGLLFAAAYAGTGSAPFVLGIGLAGIAYGWNVQRCGSIWPAILGHSVLLISQVMLAPLIG
jgi:membrane protease YdiL (CAAX protease family)